MMEHLRQNWEKHRKVLSLTLLPIVVLLAVLILCGEEGASVVETVPTEREITFDLEVNPVHSSDEGLVRILPAEKEAQTSGSLGASQPEALWQGTEPLSSEVYTDPQEAKLEDCLAVLSIPKIALSAQVFEAESSEMEAMTKGIAHFAITSAWDGNVGLCSHNVAPQGAVAYFRDLHLLQEGDEIRYKTALGERSYAVCQVKEIDENDWSVLKNTADGINRLTLLTCISGKPQLRLMVQAEEIISEERP